MDSDCSIRAILSLCCLGFGFGFVQGSLGMIYACFGLLRWAVVDAVADCGSSRAETFAVGKHQELILLSALEL